MLEVFQYPRRALFIQIKQAGDCLLCTPAARAFKKAYPTCELHFLVSERYKGILEGNKHIDRIIEFEEGSLLKAVKTALTLRGNGYDIVVDFLSSPTSSKLAYATGAKIRIGFGGRGRSWAYNKIPVDLNPDDYSAKHKLELLKLINVKDDGLRLDFMVPYEEMEKVSSDLRQFKSGLLAVVPVSRRPYKRYPPEHFAGVLNRMTEEFNITPMLLCGPGETPFLTDIKMKLKGDFILREVNSFQQFGAYIAHSKMFFGNDNGPKHIAVALGVPTFVVIGHINPSNWTPPDDLKHTFIRQRLDCQLDCNPKKCINFRCIEDIPPAEVYVRLKEHYRQAVSNEVSPD
ncbi:MAG: hypothetical protein GF307_03005 [candidate division Zixibacteria bacterium]|nr:hypothetical protein [candidate division Zixibacteria bacterium]